MCVDLDTVRHHPFSLLVVYLRAAAAKEMNSGEAKNQTANRMLK